MSEEILFARIEINYKGALTGLQTWGFGPCLFLGHTQNKLSTVMYGGGFGKVRTHSDKMPG